MYVSDNHFTVNQGQSSSEDFKLEAFNEAENLDFLFEFHSQIGRAHV